MEKTLKEVFHLNPEIKRKNGKFGLPFYLTAGKEFYDVRIENVGFCVVALKNMENTDIRKLRHDMSLYEEAFGGNVACCISDLPKRKREALLKAGISFIVPPCQVYLPFLGIALQDRLPERKTLTTERMSPLEQQLFLFLVYHGQEHKKADLAEILQVTRAAISKVTAALRSKMLIKERRQGKEVYVSLSGLPRACYVEARKWMINPIKRIAYCRNVNACAVFLKAGESALSDLSMLSSPEREVRACYEKDERLASLELLDDDRWVDENDLTQLELWKYDPGVLAGNHMVDVISLELSMENVTDERVQGEMQAVMEEYKWQ